jgi:hypothetical protein
MAQRSTQLLNQWVPGLMLSRGKAENSSPSVAEVNNNWSYASTFPYIFIVWFLIEHRGNFYLYLTLHIFVSFLYGSTALWALATLSVS